MFKLFEKKTNSVEEIVGMRDNIGSMRVSIECLTKDIEKLRRILAYGRDDAITHETIEGHFAYLCYRNSFTYIYKDGQEYKLDNLCLHKPKFKLGDIKHIVFVKDSVVKKDKIVKKKYVIDLSNCSFTQTK